MNKKAFIISNLILSILLLTSINTQSVDAEPELQFNDVIIQLTYDSVEYKPYLYIEIGSIYDSVIEENLTGVQPDLSNCSYIIYDSSDNVLLQDVFKEQENHDSKYNTTVDLYNIPNGLYYVGFNFENPVGGSNKTGDLLKNETSFTLHHTAFVSYTAIFNEEEDTLLITCEVHPTYSKYEDDNKTAVDFGTMKYHIEKNGREVLSGNLTYQSNKKLVADDISMKNQGTAIFKVWVEIEYKPISETLNTDSVKNEQEHSFYRENFLEDILTYTLYIVIGVVAIVIIIVLYARRGTGNIEKRNKKKEDEEIETIDIKNTKIRETKKPKKVKGKTQANKDLIFSVPQWEVDEDDEEDEKES